MLILYVSLIATHGIRPKLLPLTALIAQTAAVAAFVAGAATQRMSMVQSSANSIALALTVCAIVVVGIAITRRYARLSA